MYFKPGERDEDDFLALTGILLKVSAKNNFPPALNVPVAVPGDGIPPVLGKLLV